MYYCRCTGTCATIEFGFNIRRKMPQSETVSKLAKALVAAQSAFKPIPKSKTGQEGNRKFKYADLADVVSMVTPILNSNGIFLSQPIVVDGSGTLRQTTRLQLEDEFIQTDGVKLSDDTPGKNLGISVTYARRIDLNGLLGIAPDEDLDAPDLKAAGTTALPSGHSNLARSATTPVPGNASTTVNKATSFVYGANVKQTNPEITDEDLPDFDKPLPEVEPLSKEAQAVADHMATFVPLTEKRNTEIQNRLKELVANKTVGRRELSFFLEEQHEGKKQFDVSATQWEQTIKKIEDAVADGSIKTLLKKKETN